MRGMLFGVFSALTYVFALQVTWIAFAKYDFAFPFWYEVLDIDEHIETYGPRNTIKRNFHLTAKQERLRLFNEINSAVHTRGAGLTDIYYYLPNGASLGRMLTAAEVQHLEDVGVLIAKLKTAGWWVTGAWALLLLVSLATALRWPKIWHVAGLGFAVFGMLAAIIVVLGPVKVFYALHEWVFPKGHQWFFYYEESLMTMLMKAPDLFGGIALVLGTGSLLLWFALIAAVVTIARKSRRFITP